MVMLTGDNRTTAQAVARKLGITEVEAEVLPEQKSAVVGKLRREGRVVAMAGDGVNDAPALAAAEVGIAMGTGTEVAIESAGITLVKGDLAGIVRARRCRGDNAQHPAKPVLRLHLQRRRDPDRGRRALPVVRHSVVADHRRGGDGAVLGQRHRQRAAAAAGATVTIEVPYAIVLSSLTRHTVGILRSFFFVHSAQAAWTLARSSSMFSTRNSPRNSRPPDSSYHSSASTSPGWR